MNRTILCDRCKEEVEDGIVFDISSFTPELFSLHCLCSECAREIEEAFEDDYYMKEETVDEYLEEERYAYQESKWEMDTER